MNKKQTKQKLKAQQKIVEPTVKTYLNINKNKKYVLKNLNSFSVDKILNTLEKIEHFFN